MSMPPETRPIVFLKLGGSLITDKRRANTARLDRIRRLADEVRQAIEAAPDTRLLLGHGSGSFGHWAAQSYGTRQGVHTPEEWRGYAQVAASAARLHRIVADAFLDTGVPILSVPPSASALCHNGELRYLDMRPIHAALTHGLPPLIYGDVALDEVRGGTILSTEDLFLFLAERLHPSRILLAGEVEGVLDQLGVVLPLITPNDLPTLRPALSGSAGPDVTGGMADKVARMVELVQRHPETQVCIFSAVQPGALIRALLDDKPLGTRIVALQK